MEFEKILIAACLQDSVVFKRAVRSNLKHYHFSNEVIRYLFRALSELSKYKSFNRQVVEEFIKADEELVDKSKALYLRYLDDYYKEDITGYEFSLDVLRKKAKEYEVKLIVNVTGKKALAGGESYDEIAKYLFEKSSALMSQDRLYEENEYWEEWDERKAERFEMATQQGLFKMDLNLSPFEKYFPMGLPPRTITTVGGPTFSGKSVLLSNFIRLAVHPVNGLNTLYIYTENRNVEASTRLDAIILDRAYTDFYLDEMADPAGDEFFKGGKGEGWGRLRTVKLPPNGFTAVDIRYLLDDYINEGFTPDVVMFDSPEHQKPVDGSIGHEGKSQVYLDLKGIVDDYDLILFTTIQLTAGTKKKDVLDNEDVSGSKAISRHVDNNIFFNIQKDDNRLGRASLQVTKNRTSGLVDDRILHFKFKDSLRLIPWEEYTGNFEDEIVFNGSEGTIKSRFKRERF